MEHFSVCQVAEWVAGPEPSPLLSIRYEVVTVLYPTKTKEVT
jgi:hypothetical protein